MLWEINLKLMLAVGVLRLPLPLLLLNAIRYLVFVVAGDPT